MSGTPLSGQYRWQRTYSAGAVPSAVTGAGTYVIGPQDVVLAGAANSHRGGIDARLADLEVYERETEWRYDFTVLINSTAPGINLYVAMFAVAAAIATANAGFTLGAEVVGSRSETLITPAASSQGRLVGPNFKLPSDGIYTLGLVTTGALPATSTVTLIGHLGVVAR